MNARETFEAAVRYIKLGDYEKAICSVANNPPSDQRIIEKRIQEAMANDANRTEQQ